MLLEQARDLEQAVLGGILLAPSSLGLIDLVAADFPTEQGREIFGAICDVARDEPVEIVTVAHRLQEITGRNWAKTLSEIMRNTPSSANITNYASSMREKSRLMACNGLLKDYQRKVAQDGLPAVDELISKLMGVTSIQQSHEHSTSDMLRAVVDTIDERRKGNVKSISTGLADLDKIIDGFHDSDLAVIAGRPAMGKTGVMLNLAASANAPIGIISSEQPVDQIGMRIVARDGRISITRMRSGAMDDGQWDALGKSVARLNDAGNFWINDNCQMTIADVERQARKWRHSYGIKALYVDYIQRIRSTNQAVPRHEQIGEIVRGLKNIARNLQIPVIALAQVARKVEERPDKRPNMGDISDSSEVEKEADQVLTLYRDEVYNDQSPDTGIMEINIAKNRHGPTGVVRCIWQPEILAIQNIARDY